MAQLYGTSIEWLLIGKEPAPEHTIRPGQHLLDLAATELQRAKLPDAEEFTEMMQDAFKNR